MLLHGPQDTYLGSPKYIYEQFATVWITQYYDPWHFVIYARCCYEWIISGRFQLSTRKLFCKTSLYYPVTLSDARLCGTFGGNSQRIHMHDDAIKWKHFPRYWPFVRAIHKSTVNPCHIGQRRGALMFSLICTWINGWVNNGEAGDLRRHRAHYDVIVMWADTPNLVKIELDFT